MTSTWAKVSFIKLYSCVVLEGRVVPRACKRFAIHKNVSIDSEKKLKMFQVDSMIEL